MSGKYLPSYFEMHIATDSPLTSLYELPSEVQALYFHEYIHFLQNITSTYGLYKTWNVYDRIRQIITDVQKRENPIKIPLEGSVVDEQKAYFRHLLSVQGTKETSGHNFDNGNISSIKISRTEFMEKHLQDSEAYLVELELKDKEGNTFTYNFGELAVSESMAYLLEKKFYTLPIPTNFPYCAASLVANHLYPEIANNEEYLYALCDVSLMHPIPGWAFYDFCTTMKNEGIIPSKSEEIYEFGFSHFQQKGWNIWNIINESIDACAHILDILYNHEFFIQTKDWLKYIITTGGNIRKSRPHYILDIYRQDKPLGRALGEMVLRLGGPHCINRKYERAMLIPEELKKKATKIFPQQLTALEQIHNLLLGNVIPCKLQKLCETSQPPVKIDSRCQNEPWKRAQGDALCPFGAAWRIYGFHEKKFEINGNLIDQSVK